jgi:hypothetical protein
MKRVFLAGLVLLAACTNVFAVGEEDLQQQRINTVKNYVKLLGRGDYQTIPTLFTKNAVAVSSAGESDSINHFYESLFSKSISSPQSKLINVFNGQLKDNMMTAYYNLIWKNKNGELNSARFLDLIIFQANSTKIKTVYVFSNKFQESAFYSS